ncbi:4Fe-4S cluster-binding domain-containing protein [Phytohabitans sp. LJ34]|uniref:4Fe-4S cluster-binding domain-containing protein n=1 Tax=Phytohabitans sp. LJ34 TaxID=3452217 RepID=UPI003F8A17AB
MALTALITPWRVHAVLPRSVANGPGQRFTIWSQGCALACPGCFNPETHGLAGGAVRTVGELVDAVLAEVPGIEGVTLTGGEPLEQPGAVAAFCAQVTARADLGVIVLTGFTRAEIEADPARAGAVAAVDLVVAGRYNRRMPVATGLRGSANKVYWDRTGRYRPSELAAVPELEVTLGVDGTVTVTGMAAPGRALW